MEELKSIKESFSVSVKNMTDSKAWIQNQLGFSKAMENETCKQNVTWGNYQLDIIFRNGSWKFDEFYYEEIEGVFPVDSETVTKVLNFATVSQQMWDVYCLMCTGE